ncbi:hypothetical protein [sulfur-oxidizing endosymbiont of Gigantopelta aegis]|uniref:hypothetical protein n=1 Tax=sulfur-oxidizing endosymbiont of Gigantopelta aegis TaxID=2794934 RepID=UPI0018DEBB68|nr:hypothetical protein [sulfur-oxidizing endosymbiont of Gigantopelta aegis]
MKKNDIQQVIFDALEMVNNSKEESEKIPVSNETELYGKNGYLDSMGLVAFLIDIEESMMDQDVNISLSDERAMSQSNSPFKNVASLTTYIEDLV